MKKQIKRYGNSLVITFDKEEIEWFGLKEGGWIDLLDIKVIKKEDKDGKNSR